MKAALFTQYGAPEVLQLSTIEKPVPKKNELLIRVQAASVTAGDVRVRSSDFPTLVWLPARFIFGLFKPKKKILGHEFAGIVEAVGSEVSQFKIGDEVMGTTTMLNTGSYAAYMCIPEQWKSGVVGLKPSNLSFNESATLPIGGMTALFLLKKAKIKAGHKVLIYGASGSVGSYAVQIAKHFGAYVTGVCSTRNMEMVQSLGADEVIDYTKTDFSELEEQYDIVFEAVGKTSKSKAKQVLKKGGAYVSIHMLTSESKENLAELKKLVEQGALTPYIDRTYPLDQIVEAHQYVDTGRKRGNVVIEVHAE